MNSVTRRLRTIEMPRHHPGDHELYDVADGPRNPRGYKNPFEYLDPTGELAVFLADHDHH